MIFALVLACTIVVVWLLRKPIRKYPALFYALAVLLNVLYLAGSSWGLPPVIVHAVSFLMQKCTLSLAFFTVVMYIGVFAKDSQVSLGLRPARAELSVIGCLLALGHMLLYLRAFLPRFISGVDARFLFFILTAFALLALLLVLGATSFASVKRRMDAAKWKALQRWAYVFFGLVFVHLATMLLPAALSGGATARANITVYAVLALAYVILRVRRWRLDAAAPADAAPATAE